METEHDSATGETTRYYYDDTGRLVSRATSAGDSREVVQYLYDRYGRLMTTRVSDSWDMSGAYYTDYAYDEENRVKSAVSGLENQTAAVQNFCNYDDLDRVSKRFTKQMSGSTGATKLTTTFTRKSGSDQVTSLRQTAPGYDVTYAYTYNDDGFIATVTDGTNPTRYTYDGAGQLIREDNKGANKSWTWIYDAAGNILSKSTYAYTTGTLGTATATVTYGYGNANWGDLLTSYNGTAITYDSVGNPLSYRGNACTWRNGRQLVSYGAWSFTYDADGLRTSRTKGSTTVEYTYVDGVLLQMTVGTNTLRFTYAVDGTPCSVNYNGTEYYYVTNLQGDVIAILDGNGQEVVTYSYDAWGQTTTSGPMADTLGVHNPLRYRGYVYDEETGLYYVSSRYYDSEIGRFINADTTDILTATPMGLTDKNLFAYCDNNPVMRADHGGDFWHIVVGAAVGALIGGVVKAVSNAIEGKSLTDGLATAMLAGAASGALASTGVGIVGMVAGNAAISMAENAADQVIENKGFNNFDVGDMLIDGAIGGVSGALGGTGKGTKHLTNLGKQTAKRTFNATTNKGLRAGLKEAGKAFAYYGKNSAKYYKTFVKGLPSDFISTVGTTIASSNYMKYQYRRIFGR